MGSELGGSQPCAPATRNASSSSELYGHHHSRGTEGKDYCPHSILLRPHLRLAGGFGTAGAENSCEEPRQRKLEQLPGARRFPWSGAGSAWGSPQRCGDGHPEAWLLTEVRGGRWRHGEREGKQGPDALIPICSRSPVPSRGWKCTGNRTAFASPLRRDTPLVSPSRDSGSSPTATRGRVPDFAQRSPPSLSVFFLVVCLHAGLSNKEFLQSSLFPPVTHAFPCPYHGDVSGFEVESFITFPELALSCSADRPGYVSTRSLISARAGGTLESHFR